MTTHLLQIHIGPMQRFIAAARRTRDLWFGSWLMSELSKATAGGVAKLEGADALIFPAATLQELEPGSPYAVANRIVALVSENNPQSVAEAAEKSMRARLNDIVNQTFDDPLIQKLGQPAWKDVQAQIADLPEFYWVSLPIPGEGDYPRVRLQAEALLAARKNCRDFEQPPWSKIGKPKSSLDGARESVIPEASSGNSQEMYDYFRARPAEQLSGVDLLKRLGRLGKQDRFPSTSHMAAAPLRYRLRGEGGEVKKRWDNYFNQLPTSARKSASAYDPTPHSVFGDADGSLLFESRLLDYYDEQVPQGIKRALKYFYNLDEVPPPIPYYALLIADGDFMGRTINKLESPQAHRRFSQALASFAIEAKNIIESPDFMGAAVFTGGDDVLGFLPLHTAVECASALSAAFQQQMKSALDGTAVEAPTFSAGIAIVHHLEPLEDSLELARAAEKEAKSLKGKNALAINLAKRSGAPRLVCGHWGGLDKRLQQFTFLYRRNDLPQGLPYQLRDMVLHLGGSVEVAGDQALKAVVGESAGLILQRKQATQDAVAYLEAELLEIDHDQRTIESIANELIIAGLLAQAQDQAYGESLKKEGTHAALDH